MSEPKQYDDVIGMLTDQCHQYAIENARLKADVERLTAFTTRTIIPNEELQAQVERLTKAGDAMGEEMLKLNHPHASIYLWCKAKEGKQP